MTKFTELDPFESIDWETRCRLWQAPHDEQDKYYPQIYQERFHREMTWRMKPTSGGIGAAKTTTIAHDYMHEAIAAVYRKEMGYGGADGYNGRIAITGLTYDQPRIAFNYLLQKWDAAGLIKGKVSRPKDGQWYMETKTGVEVMTISSDKPEAFAARPYTIVHMCEAAQQPIEMLHAAMERTSRWKMPWPGRVYPEGTFEEHGMHAWYPEMCRMWQFPNQMNAKFFRFRSWENAYNFPGGINNPKIQEGKRYYAGIGRPDLFMVRYGGEVPVNPTELWGGVFSPEQHVSRDAEFRPLESVDIAIDPGTHRYAVLFIQCWDEAAASETVHHVDVIDELVIENADYDQVRELIMLTPYAKQITYGVSDVAATQRSQSNESTHARWAAPNDDKHKGMGLTLDYQYVSKEDGLNVLKAGLRGEYYRLRINPRCTGLLSDIQKEKLDEFGQLDERLNKGNDDCRKALSYYLRCKKGFVPIRRERRPSGLCLTGAPGRTIATSMGNMKASL